jgi:ATP-dependent DNA helicase RecG
MKSNPLPKKESDTVEFKTAFDLELTETLSAFANSKGGAVYLGVDDKGRVAGIEVGTESTSRWLNQIKTSTAPSLLPEIEIISANGKDVAVFAMPEYPIKPVACKGRYFKRAGNSNHQMNVSEVADMHLHTFNTSWDAYPDQLHTLEGISLKKVARVLKNVNRHRERPLSLNPREFLDKNELVRKDAVTHAAFLLFMKGESALSTIELGRFQTETIIKDSARLKTDLFAEVDGVMEFIKKHINKNIIITGEPQHEERWEYPIEALREVVLNAIIHRDYTQSADTVIKVFEDKIEFYNPGGLPPGLTVQKLLAGNYVSKPRNKKIAEVFKDAGLIEKYGSGIKRILYAFKAAGARKPEIIEIGEGIRVTVYAAPANAPANAPVNAPASLNEVQEMILRILTKNATASMDEMAHDLHKDRATIRRNIAKLKKNGWLKRTGADKNGLWRVVRRFE